MFTSIYSLLGVVLALMVIGGLLIVNHLFKNSMYIGLLIIILASFISIFTNVNIEGDGATIENSKKLILYRIKDKKSYTETIRLYGNTKIVFNDEIKSDESRVKITINLIKGTTVYVPKDDMDSFSDYLNKK